MHTPGTRGGRDDHVQSIARQLLDERLEELTDSALTRLMGQEPAYAGLAMDADLRRRGMRSTLDLALRRVAGDTLPALENRATTEVGRERARQGFPLAALMHSFQLDLRVLWEAVLTEGRARGISTNSGFLDALIRVWEATDANTVEVVQAYRRTENEIAEARNELRGRAFERLILNSDVEPASVTQAATVLGLPTDQPVLVLVGDGVEAASTELRRCRDALHRSSTPHHLAWIGDELVGVFVVGRTGDSVIRQAMGPLSTRRCGVSQVSTLAETATGLRLARAAARGFRRSGIHDIQASWIEAFATADDELGARLVRSVIRPVLAAPDRNSLLETLEAYLRTGSVTSVASETYRHRNTVRNRLRRIEELCHIDLSVPRDVAAVALAVSSYQAGEGRA